MIYILSKAFLEKWPGLVQRMCSFGFMPSFCIKDLRCANALIGIGDWAVKQDDLTALIALRVVNR